MTTNILVCDDEEDIVNAISIYLKAEGYNIFTAHDGKKALSVIRSEEISLVLLDIMMPNMDGITALTKIREEYNLPVIMLTAKSEDTDKVMGLNLGADDYITKPFSPLELVARVKSHLRRYTKLGAVANETGIYTLGGIELNNNSKEVTVDGEPVKLTKTEYDILKFLMENKGKVFTPKEIYSKVWDDVFLENEGTVAVHIRHLREKIEIDPSSPRYIKVIWGQGYKMDEGK
ncbi:MAG: response regulator transcription factor [Acetatifactor sp.]|nr:response regulator transcription factor [Acetatifactor sp.]